MLDQTQRLEPFSDRVWLSSPTMHGEEMVYIQEAYDSNWMSTLGKNIDSVEQTLAEFTGTGYCVALSSGTAALHLAIKLAGERLYGPTITGKGALNGRYVFCSDLTFDATVNPVVYEGGVPVFIDTEYDTWNMDPASLEKAFELYPDVKLIDLAHLYGSPAKMDEIRRIAQDHGALIIEDAAESLGATYKGKETGSLGDYSCISFNGNKIITGSSGGAFLTNSREDADRIRKWSTQSRDAAPWYQHTELGYNYRMSNVIAGVIRGQLLHLDEHIAGKRTIYERYRKGLSDLPVSMNPYDSSNSQPNMWLSSIIIDKEAMAPQVRSDDSVLYTPTRGKSCPTEILNLLASLNAEGRPIWKPMHMQPIYRMNPFVSASGTDVGADIFQRGLCLPSDNKMTEEVQDRIIQLIHSCFD